MITLYKLEDNIITFEGKTVVKNFKSQEYYINDANRKCIIHTKYSIKEKVCDLYVDEISVKEGEVTYNFTDGADEPNEVSVTGINDAKLLNEYLYFSPEYSTTGENGVYNTRIQEFIDLLCKEYGGLLELPPVTEEPVEEDNNEEDNSQQDPQPEQPAE